MAFMVDAAGECMVDAAGECMVDAAGSCMVDAAGECMVDAAGECMVDAAGECMVDAAGECMVDAAGECMVDAAGECMVDAAGECMVDAAGECMVDFQIGAGLYAVGRPVQKKNITQQKRTAKSAPITPCPSREGPYSTVFSVSRPMDPLMWLAGFWPYRGMSRRIPVRQPRLGLATCVRQK